LQDEKSTIVDFCERTDALARREPGGARDYLAVIQGNVAAIEAGRTDADPDDLEGQREFRKMYVERRSQ